MSYTQIASLYLAAAAKRSGEEAAHAWPEGSDEIPVTTSLDHTVQRSVSDTNRLIQEES
jgi:hypothetical protein